jgi:hypothetical protein
VIDGRKKNSWDERLSVPEYVCGTEPNGPGSVVQILGFKILER